MILLPFVFLSPLVVWLILCGGMGMRSYPRWLSYRNVKLRIDAMLIVGFTAAGCVALVVQSGALDASMPRSILLFTGYYASPAFSYPAQARGALPLHVQGERRTVRIATPYTRTISLLWDHNDKPECSSALAEHPPVLHVTITSTKGDVLGTDTFPLRWGKERKRPPQWSTVIPQQDDPMVIATIAVAEASPDAHQCARGFRIWAQ